MRYRAALHPDQPSRRPVPFRLSLRQAQEAKPGLRTKTATGFQTAVVRQKDGSGWITSTPAPNADEKKGMREKVNPTIATMKVSKNHVLLANGVGV